MMEKPPSSGEQCWWGRRVKRGRAALTSPACSYQWRLIYWGMDVLMQLSVSSQATHLWICFSTVWPSVPLQLTDKTLRWWRGNFLLFTLRNFCCRSRCCCFFSAKCYVLQAGWMGLNIGFIVWFWWAVKMILSHNGWTLVSDRYIVEIDEEGRSQLNIGITLSAH